MNAVSQMSGKLKGTIWDIECSLTQKKGGDVPMPLLVQPVLL